MTFTSKHVSARSSRIFLVGISFVIGLTSGVFAMMAFQSLTPATDLNNQVNSNGVEQKINYNGESTSTIGGHIQIQGIFEHPTVFDQYALLYSTLSTATEQELKEWWVQSQKIERTSHRETFQEAVLRKLVAFDPEAAIQLVNTVSQLQSGALLSSVFGEWSLSDLDSAIGAAKILSGPQRKIALQAILRTRDDLPEDKHRSIALQLKGEETFLKLVSDTKASRSIAKPQESWNVLLNDDVADNLQTESLIIVAEAWQEQVGFAVLSDIFTEIEDYHVKLQLVRAVAQVDLAAALEYTRGLVDGREKQYLSGIIGREWARTDAHAAILAVSTFQPPSLASRLENDVLTTWAVANPTEVIENIELLSEEFRVSTLELAFMQIARKEPIAAIAKVRSVESSIGNTSSIVRKIVHQWSSQKPDDAIDWVVQNFAPEDSQRGILLEVALPFLALQNPERAVELALEQPVPDDGPGLDYLVLREIAREGDIDVAKKFLSRVHKNSKSLVYTEIGSVLVRESQTFEALELGTELEEKDQQVYYRYVFNTWARTNPKNLFNSLDDLPTPRVKSSAALQLVLSNRVRPLLTEEQINQAKTQLSADDEAKLNEIENR